MLNAGEQPPALISCSSLAADAAPPDQMKQPAYLAATSNLLEDELDHCRGLASAWGTVYESHILAGQGLIHCLHLFTGSGSKPTVCASVLLLCTLLAEHRMGMATWLS